MSVGDMDMRIPDGTWPSPSVEPVPVSPVPAFVPCAIEPYENTLSIEELRREVRKLWDRQNALRADLVSAPIIPSIGTMQHLSSAGMQMPWPQTWEIGKKLQREHPGRIPWKTEYECAAGLWSIIQPALASAIEARQGEKPQALNAQHESAVGESPDAPEAP